MMDEHVGYCIYCKEEVTEDNDYVKVKGKLYHANCFDLMKEEIDAE